MTTPMHTARSATLSFDAHGGGQESARFELLGEAGGQRSFVQSSSMAMREGAPSTIGYREVAGQPSVHSGSLAFDALFAHAIVEMTQNAVGAIRDAAYNDGRPMPCECFETGEKWHYVWTRDLSYAANLGLAMLDPQRVRNSLEFKLSGYRAGVPRAPFVAGSEDGLQIIQDTGSGGSWPVSTDRVSWAFGAEETLKALPPAERAAFATTALKALSNTLENDRLAAFDPRDGLYTGEQSFLDWREQSYGAGIADDLTRMASAKALSTNVMHFKALSLAAQLAGEQGEQALSARYLGWAGALKAAINARFWLEREGLYSSLTAPHFDGAALHKYDWLGQSLSILAGVADADQRTKILASYPHGPVGAPVIFPQQQGVPIYHNRSIWPFVTAYGLNAAVMGRNVSVADAAFSSLVRGAALHLSNMENMEWLSGAALLHDAAHPQLDGPVINSRRQLWSVGAYLGMVIHNIFGIGLTGEGIVVQPFITARLRREMFGTSELITLRQLHLRGKRIEVRIALPPAASGDGYFALDAVTLNGRPVNASIGWDQLGADNRIEVRLGALVAGQQQIRRVDGEPMATEGALFAPFEARIERVAHTSGGQIEVRLADPHNRPGSVSYRLYRNGQLVAEQLPLGTWIDPSPAAQSNCYAVEALAAGSGNRSHHSAPMCAEPGLRIAVTDPRVSSSVAVAPGAEPRIVNWGAPQDRFAVAGVALGAGRYSLQIQYINTGHAINTGISNGVKVLSVRDAGGKLVARRVIQMPHLAPDGPALYSTAADVQLGGGSYSIELGDFYNMSYLASNSVYGAGGGKTGPLNRIDIVALRILAHD